MRADRLLKLLLLLQTRGKLKSRELAQELEVSERTICRDIDALSAAGVPVYGDPGPQGGYALVESYRTNLTGLTEGEVRALFMLSVPTALAELGVSQELKTALLKMAASLPESRRHDEEKVRRRFFLDSTWWRQGEERVPHLQTIHKAVWENRMLFIKYQPPFAVEIEQHIAPYGLVAKAGSWYMVFARREKLSAHPVSDLIDVRILDDGFERPDSFDLAVFWREWSTGHESLFTSFLARFRVAPTFKPLLSKYFGAGVQENVARASTSDSEEWIEIELPFESFAAARERLIGFGRGVEVMRPRALRRSIIDLAEQIIDLYASS